VTVELAGCVMELLKFWFNSKLTRGVEKKPIIGNIYIILSDPTC
jgi:hypothetical protein